MVILSKQDFIEISESGLYDPSGHLRQKIPDQGYESTLFLTSITGIQRCKGECISVEKALVA